MHRKRSVGIIRVTYRVVAEEALNCDDNTEKMLVNQFQCLLVLCVGLRTKQLKKPRICDLLLLLVRIKSANQKC